MEKYEFDVRGFFGVLQRQMRLIVLTVIAVVALGSIVVFSLKPMFTASALILVDPSRKNLLTPEVQGTSVAADSARIDSEVEILRSDNVLLQVIKSQDLVADEEFGVTLSRRNQLMSFFRLSEPTLPTGEEALNQSLSKLRNAVSVQRRGATYLIALQVRSASPTKAAELANAVAAAYIADQLTSKVNSALSSRDVLQARMADARQTVLVSEGSFDTFVETNIAGIVEDTGRTDLAEMQARILELNNSRAQASSMADLAQTSVDAADIQRLVSTLQSDALNELEQQRKALQDTLDASEEGSPVVESLRSELAAVENQLRIQANTEIAQLRAQVAQTQADETALREQLRTSVLQSPLSADMLTQLYELQQGAEVARTQYQTLLSRVQDLEAQASLQIPDSRVVSPALAPSGPSFPNTSLILTGATAAALVLGIALAFLYENVLGGFTSEAQLESVLKARTASSIPRVKGKGNESNFANLMVESPLSVFAESVRRIRAQVDQFLRQRPMLERAPRGSVIMVSSTAPGEGKTTVALSLARSYALSGRTTLLIDCDLRKPSIHKQLGVEPSQGFLEFLSDPDSLSLSAIVQEDPMSGATVVLGARKSGLPTDQLIAGPAFQRMIEAARKTFDIIIVDTPPIGPVVDGVYIAPSADAIVYVVRWASTAQNEARESLRTLAAAAPAAGIFTVLNQQDKPQGAYRHKYRDYYAEYS